MLVFGKVSKINAEDYTVKLKLDDYDGEETPWLAIPQLWARNNKSGWLPEIQTLCAAYLTEDMTEGFLIGAKYNDEDRVLVEYKGKDFVRFSDGVTICHTPDSKKLEIIAEKIEITGDLTCTGNISDKKGTVQSIRDFINRHKHTNGNNGSDTGTPTEDI